LYQSTHSIDTIRNEKNGLHLLLPASKAFIIYCLLPNNKKS